MTAPYSFLRSRWGISLVLFGALGFIGCGGDPVAGGGPTGTEAGNAITARIVDSRGLPVPQALARLRPVQYRTGTPTPEAWNTTTNDSGNLVLQPPPSGNYHLEVRHPSGGLLLHLDIDSTQATPLGTGILQAFTQLHGQVPQPFSPGTTVQIVGTELVSPVDADGNFLLDSLPPSPALHPYALEARSPNAPPALAYARTTAGQSQSVGLLRAENTHLILDDFSDGNSQHRYWSLDGGGWWYMAKHPEVALSGDFTLNTTLPLHVATAGDSGTTGHFVHYSVTVDSTAVNPWAELGVQLGRLELGYDLSSVDTIAFWAKGAGNLVFRLQFTDGVQVFAEGTTFMEISPTWAEHIVVIADLVVNNFTVGMSGGAPAATSLDSLLPSVRGVSFTFVDDAEFWLDRVELRGASREAIWGR